MTTNNRKGKDNNMPRNCTFCDKLVGNDYDTGSQPVCYYCRAAVTEIMDEEITRQLQDHGGVH